MKSENVIPLREFPHTTTTCISVYSVWNGCLKGVFGKMFSVPQKVFFKPDTNSPFIGDNETVSFNTRNIFDPKLLPEVLKNVTSHSKKWVV